jgi:hypothetical protein
VTRVAPGGDEAQAARFGARVAEGDARQADVIEASELLHEGGDGRALSDATARCWGGNVSGGLGDGTFEDSPVPVVVRADR